MSGFLRPIGTLIYRFEYTESLSKIHENPGKAFYGMCKSTKMCLLEGAEAGWATATGMAAVFTTFAALLNSGDHVLACRSVFGSTHSVLTKLLPKWG